MLLRSVSLLLFLFVALMAMPAQAIPAFSKKYEAPCSLCHTVWPRLNSNGAIFKLNGYQLPDGEDGGKASKLTPAKGLFLDTGDANLPVSLLLNGGMTWIKPETGPEGKQNNQFFSDVNGNDLSLVAGGTAAPNIAYYFSYKLGDENVSQAYLRFMNFFSPGLAGLEIGAMKVIDYDVVSPGREWIDTPNIAMLGHPYYRSTDPPSSSAAGFDTGIRIFGRPGFSIASYEAAIYTGNSITGRGEDDSGQAFTVMGRIDVEKLAFSLRYWTNSGAASNLSVIDSAGTTLNFDADRLNGDETTTELIFGARYTHTKFEVSFSADLTNFDVGERSMTDSAGTAHTLKRSAVKRIGLSGEVFWIPNKRFAVGLGYGQSTIADYDMTVDGDQNRTVKGITTSLITFKTEIRPVSNMKISLLAQIDTSSAEAKIADDGSSFAAQNRLSIKWAFTF